MWYLLSCFYISSEPWSWVIYSEQKGVGQLEGHGEGIEWWPWWWVEDFFSLCRRTTWGWWPRVSHDHNLLCCNIFAQQYVLLWIPLRENALLDSPLEFANWIWWKEKELRGHLQNSHHKEGFWNKSYWKREVNSWGGLFHRSEAMRIKDWSSPWGQCHSGKAPEEYKV